MKNNSGNLILIIVFNIISLSLNASVTKVGNGDDGSDLENLTKITSGPILKAKNKALILLDKLNIVGVPGLGSLIPELEQSEIYMTNSDVHPTNEQRGSIEISDDYKTVYARTFAEPHAATRFFPATKKLNIDQLVALHIHEALHRSLPENIRQNENIVTHFTMAITSHGASFDRIFEVSKMYINTTPSINGVVQNKESDIIKIDLPEKQKSHISYTIISYGNEEGLAKGYRNNIDYLEYRASLFDIQIIKGYAVEYITKLKAIVDYTTKKNYYLGPSSIEIQADTQLSKTSSIGPFLRYSIEAPDNDNFESNGNKGRDILTLGCSFENKNLESYNKMTIGYSGESIRHGGYSPTDDEKFGSIFSVWASLGYKYKKLDYGVLAEYHSSQDAGSASPFKLILLGPEIQYDSDKFKINLFYKTIVNSKSANLTNLGDILDRGYGRNGIGLTLAYLF